MPLLDRVAKSRKAAQKSFVQPPFWATDVFRTLYNAPVKPNAEPIENDFEGFVAGAYKGDSVIFACIAARMLVFSEARFQWRQFSKGRPGDLFGSPELDLLEHPWPGGTTGDLLTHIEVDASLAGNAYVTKADDRGRLGNTATGPGVRLARMRPDWVTLMIKAPSGNPLNPDARVVGVAFQVPPQYAGGPKPPPIILTPDEVCHFSPIPDPVARFRGMSWITPLIDEVEADRQATRHKLNFFQHGATPNLAVQFDKETSEDAFNAFVDKYRLEHEGVDNAYKTLFLAGGADAKPLSINLRELEFKATQGAGETRIAAAARVPPVIVGLSEGLAGSSLNAGNYNSAKRNFVDGTVRPMWRMLASSLQVIITPPNSGANLWYDDRDIPYLREDLTALVDIHKGEASMIQTLTNSGFKPEAVVDAVVSGDFSRLKGQHTGLFSVQLQPPGTVAAVTNPMADQNQPNPSDNTPAARNGQANAVPRR